MTGPGTVEQRRWYPSPAPALDGETDDGYTSRLAGACGPAAIPYDHVRNRQCSIGWHLECSEHVRLPPAGAASPAAWIAAQREEQAALGAGNCQCPCHADVAALLELPDPLPPALNLAAARLSKLYSVPPVTGLRVMLIAGHALPPGTARSRRRAGTDSDLAAVGQALQLHYGSPQGAWFLADVVQVYAAAHAGTPL